MPAAVLIAGYIGFGALAAGHGLPLVLAVASTPVLWALPAQLILAEMHHLGAPFLATLLTVSLSSARFLPMTVMLMPMMHDPRHRPWRYYALAHLLSLSGWAMAVARFPRIAQPERLAWFGGFALTLMAASAAATAVGFVLADRLTPFARTGLVFMAPMYYLLILLGSARERTAVLGLACGTVAGPLAYLASPQWSVLAGGLAGGSLAYWIIRRMQAHG